MKKHEAGLIKLRIQKEKSHIRKVKKSLSKNMLGFALIFGIILSAMVLACVFLSGK